MGGFLSSVTAFRAFAGVLVALSGVLAAHAQNIVANPGFETPVIGNGAFQSFNGGSSIGAWTVVGASVILLDTNYSEPGNGVAPFAAQEGIQSLDLTGSGNTGPTSGVQQTLSTTEGVNYFVSFFVGRAISTTNSSFYQGPATVDLSINGGARVSFSNSNTVASVGAINWQQFTTSFLATGPTTTIAFLNGTPPANNEAGLDNVSVVAAQATAPEPASLALIVMGALVGAGARAVRRRSRRR